MLGGGGGQGGGEGLSKRRLVGAELCDDTVTQTAACTLDNPRHRFVTAPSSGS